MVHEDFRFQPWHRGFAGSGGPFESTGEDYLVNVRLVEACNEAAATGRVVPV